MVKVRLDESKNVQDVRVGHTKDSLAGDYCLMLLLVLVDISSNHIVSTTGTQNLPVRVEDTSMVVNAFQVMMDAQRVRDTVRVPSPVSVRNKRDQLYNDLLSLVVSKGLEWKVDEVHSGLAARILQAIRDTLWYIDGSHATLSESGCDVSPLFQNFVGYNRPEQYKHRKRPIDNLSRDSLIMHSQCLFQILQKVFWDRPTWSEFKQAVVMLANSLATYADLLVSKRSRMDSVYSSKGLIREVSTDMTVQYIEASSSRFRSPLVLQAVVSINEAIKELGPGALLDLEKLLPIDGRRRYTCLLELKKGLEVPLILVTYAPGSNICSMHWVWHCLAADIDSALRTAQPMIEKFKENVPQYHTRAMRRAAYEKFGLLQGHPF